MSRKQAGFSMIEALVAILVLSFGLLALAGFQLRVLSDSVGASNQNIAAQLAGDMADRIRANLVTGAATDSPYVADWSAASTTAPDPSCAGSRANCSATELAADDLWNWKRRVASALPGGLANVEGNSTAGGLLFIHIAWNEPAAVDLIAPDPDWSCPSGKACQQVIVAVPQP
ncbi:type IV pilus modification protein PilV [Variovorax sp. Root411]|uniref:type IV pilus modification protein PilV n=1 Tax=Variovorax sp. Root411 TaxID=1736530 RepID=UPI0007004D38|nr:type IV pilus modification protein PilV [Variovorax sp. Root411]KQW57694.1 pilus assembly protein PilV [Variovorax sp. Root411]